MRRFTDSCALCRSLQVVWACTCLFFVQLVAAQTARSVCSYITLKLALAGCGLRSCASPTQVVCRNDSWHTLNHRPGYCALYGVCGHRNDSGHSGLDCPLNQPGKPLSGPVLQKLQDTCPQLASEYGPDGNYCCTEEQLDTLTHQVCLMSCLLTAASPFTYTCCLCLLIEGSNDNCFTSSVLCRLRKPAHYLWGAQLVITISSTFSAR